jgi:hypothetical protein
MSSLATGLLCNLSSQQTKRIIIEGYHLLDRPSIAYAKPPWYAIGKVPALIYLCQLDFNLRLDLVDEAGGTAVCHTRQPTSELSFGFGTMTIKQQCFKAPVYSS